MNCREAQSLLPAYMDGELDLVHSLDVERHLQTCADCDRIQQSHKALHTGLQAANLTYEAPAALRKRVQVSIRKAARAEAAPRAMVSWRWGAVAAAMVLLFAAAWRLGHLTSSASGDDLVRDVVTDHVRSLMASHLADVPSTDQHTVKPWFNGKLDYAPPVEDLAAEGFPLTGGRLDYLDNRTVAALVYRRQKHPINLFVWPAPSSADSDLTVAARNGYHLVHWTHAGMNFWAVSDLNATELQEFARQIEAKTSPAPAPK